MTYVVVENCIKCKYMDCVEVCPVDCFYEGENMLVIHPDECIDCGVCEPECPAEAIKPDTEPGLEKWLEVNAEYAKTWPNITVKTGAAGRRQGMGRRAGQVQEVLLGRPGRRRLNQLQTELITVAEPRVGAGVNRSREYCIIFTSGLRFCARIRL